MSLFRTGFVVVVAIMLLPTDKQKQSELHTTASSTMERTMTFCERNPATCQAGSEMWTLFVNKAEFGMELAANLIRQQLAQQFPARQSAPQLAPAPVQSQPIGGSAVPANSTASQPFARQTLTTNDRQPVWRGVASVASSPQR